MSKEAPQPLPEPRIIRPETADLDRKAEPLGDGVERDQLHPPQPGPKPDKLGPESPPKARKASTPTDTLLIGTSGLCYYIGSLEEFSCRLVEEIGEEALHRATSTITPSIAAPEAQQKG